MSEPDTAKADTRACTCPPGERPAICHHRYALSECRAIEDADNRIIHAMARIRVLLMDAGMPWPHSLAEDIEELIDAKIDRLSLPPLQH